MFGIHLGTSWRSLASTRKRMCAPHEEGVVHTSSIVQVRIWRAGMHLPCGSGHLCQLPAAAPPGHRVRRKISKLFGLCQDIAALSDFLRSPAVVWPVSIPAHTLAQAKCSFATSSMRQGDAPRVFEGRKFLACTTQTVMIGS